MKGMWLIVICQILLIIIELTNKLTILESIFIPGICIVLALANYFIARTIRRNNNEF